jgi:hypothetical protein
LRALVDETQLTMYTLDSEVAKAEVLFDCYRFVVTTGRSIRLYLIKSYSLYLIVITSPISSGQQANNKALRDKLEAILTEVNVYKKQASEHENTIDTLDPISSPVAGGGGGMGGNKGIVFSKGTLNF